MIKKPIKTKSKTLKIGEKKPLELKPGVLSTEEMILKEIEAHKFKALPLKKQILQPIENKSNVVKQEITKPVEFNLSKTSKVETPKKENHFH